MKTKTGKALLITLATFALGLTGCSEQQAEVETQEQLRPVRTIQVQALQSTPLHEFPAVVDAANTADLAFKVPGEVTELLVKQGEEVSKGEVIARLDNTDYQLSKDEAKASFDKAQADFKRAQQLIKSGVISQSDYDQLKAQFASAKSRLANANNNLDYTQLHASFSGIVSRTHIERFEEVQAKQAIVTLQDINKVHLKINVPESVMIHVSKEATKTMYAQFSAIAEQRFSLEFVEVSTQADEVTKTYEVTLSMQAPEQFNILPGMTAQVLAGNLQGEQNKLFVPLKTVLKDASGHFVWTVKALDNGQGEVQKTSVELGELGDNGFEVINGLSVGAHVITAGMSKVQAGQRVKFQGGDV